MSLTIFIAHIIFIGGLFFVGFFAGAKYANTEPVKKLLEKFSR